MQDPIQSQPLSAPANVLKESSDKIGGFEAIEKVIEGEDFLSQMNPEHRAKKAAFLTESQYKSMRESLKRSLNLWVDLLLKKESVSASTASDIAKQKATETRELLKRNQLEAVKAVRELETSYRSAALFFNNAKGEVENATFINADLAQLKNSDDEDLKKAIEGEIKSKYDRADLSGNYSLLVIPGFLGENLNVDRWASLAHDYRVMLITDFNNHNDPKDLTSFFKDGNYTGGDIYRSHVMMTCNWIVGRGKIEQIDENDDVFIYPSLAIAGRMQSSLLSQPIAGVENGNLNAKGTVIPLLRSEGGGLERIGLVPLLHEFGKVFPWSAKTLYTGDIDGFKNYYIVRVFDYVAKVLTDFLNRKTFSLWTEENRKKWRNQIINYLQTLVDGKIIKSFEITKFEQDQKDKNRINLDLKINPLWAAKSFVITMSGQKFEDDNATSDNS